jgi:hypothetical protein
MNSTQNAPLDAFWGGLHLWGVEPPKGVAVGSFSNFIFKNNNFLSFIYLYFFIMINMCHYFIGIDVVLTKFVIFFNLFFCLNNSVWLEM